jgi:hypothetical protein
MMWSLVYWSAGAYALLWIARCASQVFRSELHVFRTLVRWIILVRRGYIECLILRYDLSQHGEDSSPGQWDGEWNPRVRV